MFTVTYQIGSAEPVSVTFDISSAAAPNTLKSYAAYQGIDTTGLSVREVAEALIKEHGKAIAQGARREGGRDHGGGRDGQPDLCRRGEGNQRSGAGTGRGQQKPGCVSRAK